MNTVVNAFAVNAASTPVVVLRQWLLRRLGPAAGLWLDESLASLGGGGSDRDLYRCVSLVSRKLGKAALELDAVELAAACVARPDWKAGASRHVWTNSARLPTSTNWWPSIAGFRSIRSRPAIGPVPPRVCGRT